MDLRFLLNDSPMSPRRSRSASSSSQTRPSPSHGVIASSSRKSPRPVPSGTTVFNSSHPHAITTESRREGKNPTANREFKSRASSRRSVESPTTTRLAHSRSAPTVGHSKVATARRSSASRPVSARQQSPNIRSSAAATGAANTGPQPIKRLSRSVVGRWAWFCPLCDNEFKSGGHCRTHIATVSSPSSFFKLSYAFSFLKTNKAHN